MKDLIKIGFIKVGEWQNLNSNFNHSITNHLDTSNLLYAFVSDGKVYYIGKTDNTLRQRMNGYKNAGGTQFTNIRVKNNILELNSLKKVVEIFVLLCKEVLMFKQIYINLASGLENNLIEKFNPEWNERGKMNSRHSEIELDSYEEELHYNNFTLPVKGTGISIRVSANEVYNGRINFLERYNVRNLLPAIGSTIKFYWGNNFSNSFEATLIDSSGAKKSGNLRVNSKNFKVWCQKMNLTKGDFFTLEIINVTCMLIYK